MVEMNTGDEKEERKRREERRGRKGEEKNTAIRFLQA